MIITDHQYTCWKDYFFDSLVLALSMFPDKLLTRLVGNCETFPNRLLQIILNNCHSASLYRRCCILRGEID